MADASFIKRAQPHTPLMGGSYPTRGLGSRWAYCATAAILLLVFGWTFFTNPTRPAAADDPAYYTWRTEMLLVSEPETLLEADGPLDMYSGGYRVTTPVVDGLLRRIADVGILTPTIVLAVGLRVLIPMLLAGFAFRHRRDPLIWHAVAFGSASLLVTPPFAGYLDNVMTLLFLTAALYFIEPARTQWRARVAMFGLLILGGMTHPTTLAIFCVVLGAMAFVRFLFRGFKLGSVLRDDGPMLATAFAAAVATYAIWKVGIWGESASLSEAALPPPAGADFFKTRLNDWVGAMRPLLNGPLFVVGLVGLLAAGFKAAAEDELTRVGIVWLAPLAGVLGVFAGLTYPYYRFFNTTLAWVLLVGLGAYFLSRFFVDVARGGGIAMVALIGVVAVGFVLAGNFKAGLDKTHWNDPSDAWVKPDQQRDLEALRAQLPEGRPVVFIADDEAEEPVRIYGFTKLVGNVGRFGVPAESLHTTAVYLGSLENYLDGVPTEGSDYYSDLSRATLDDAEEVVGSDEPVIVVAEVFNASGANASWFEGPIRGSSPDVLFVADGRVEGATTGSVSAASDVAVEGITGILRTLVGALLLLLPGWLVVRFLLPEEGPAGALALGVTLGVGLLALVTVALLAITGSALTSTMAWTAFAVGTGIAGILAFMPRDPARGTATYGAGDS
jgi:hypothetical protein